MARAYTITEFRLLSTGELLWESVAPPPQKDDLVYYAVGTGELTAYEVSRIDYQYRKLVVEGPSPDGGEVEVSGALSECVTVAYVTLGT